MERHMDAVVGFEPGVVEHAAEYLSLPVARQDLLQAFSAMLDVQRLVLLRYVVTAAGGLQAMGEGVEPDRLATSLALGLRAPRSDVLTAWSVTVRSPCCDDDMPHPISYRYRHRDGSRQWQWELMRGGQVWSIIVNKGRWDGPVTGQAVCAAAAWRASSCTFATAREAFDALAFTLPACAREFKAPDCRLPAGV